MPLILMIAGAVPVLCYANESAVRPAGNGPAKDTVQHQANGAYVRHWYLSIGGSNYHPKLKESEAQVNSQVNALFGLMPRWKKPTTFADWRDEWMLWDFTVGLGRDITPRTCWMVWTGGATATIRTHERYGFINRLDTDVRFTRTTGFLTLEGYFYPMGKPAVRRELPKTLLKGVTRSLRSTRPYLALGAGYTFVRAKGDVRVELPIVGGLFRRKQVDDHHIYQVSPRVGFEIPLGADNFFHAEGIYYICGPDHGNEYDGPSMCLGFKHRF